MNGHQWTHISIPSFRHVVGVLDRKFWTQSSIVRNQLMSPSRNCPVHAFRKPHFRHVPRSSSASNHSTIATSSATDPRLQKIACDQQMICDVGYGHRRTVKRGDVILKSTRRNNSWRRGRQITVMKLGGADGQVVGMARIWKWVISSSKSRGYLTFRFPQANRGIRLCLHLET